MPCRFDVAVSHLSRSQVIAARAWGLPILVGFDDEQVATTLLRPWFDGVLVPECVPKEFRIGRGIAREKIRPYPGLQEEVSLPGRSCDGGLRKKWGFNSGRVLVTIRPPSATAHDHDPFSTLLCNRLLERIVEEEVA